MMKIKNILFFLLFSGSSVIINAQSITRLDKSRASFEFLDLTIHSLMKKAHVHGMAISIFNNNIPVYTKTFGYKKLDTKDSLETNTNIYGASLSKSLFATLVMMLVEDGIIDLDKPLQEYLPRPVYEYTPETKWHDDFSSLKNDSNYHKITARMCLAHTAGFPNWRWFEEDQKLKVKFPPGTKYNYSGEGMVYLQVVLEKMLGRSLEDLMKEKIFDPLGMKNSSYTWQPAFENNFSYGHTINGELYKKDKDNEARSASTLETTLDDYTLFLKAILNFELLNPTTTSEMFRPQVRINTIQQFGPLSLKNSTTNDNIQLSYGLGWGLLQSPYGKGAFKEGHGDGFQHYSIIFPDTGIGILIMSNSDNAESIFKYLLEETIGDVYTPWYWENYIPFDHSSD
ncbi:MAG: beta-lactamase family protein [Chitinophagaceae bacterium]|jgi:CubicO group peptidase (beta-lactamase class C family)|nr:beta-lactamase family protein [Chitinophagaceae bacterium]